MNFENVIGYETIKEELLQVCDMIRNKEVYEKMGAKMPGGILLYGDPGLGKTLMAKCFIRESGLNAYTVRRSKGTDEFVKEIGQVFTTAKKNAPSVVFLDDMDKFANEDNAHRDAEEYVAVQSGIDEVNGTGVFIIATANDIYKLPDSLMRAGRFDKKIEVRCPTENDACKIIRHYLKNKSISEDVNLEDISKMISYSSCAELETILNEAAVSAAFARHSTISMEDITKAVMRMQYDAPDNYTKPSKEDLEKVALHEAGHLVVCEVLCPGSVGVASIRSSGRDSKGGFIRRCIEFDRKTYEIPVSLAGKAAVELYYSEDCADGCESDIRRAYADIRDAICHNGITGMGYIDIKSYKFPDTSENLNSRTEAVVHAELERYLLKARDILLKNRNFLETVAEQLLEKETLLFSDIKRIRESVSIVDVAV